MPTMRVVPALDEVEDPIKPDPAALIVHFQAPVSRIFVTILSQSSPDWLVSGRTGQDGDAPESHTG
jgi:hypothetical protein